MKVAGQADRYQLVASRGERLRSSAGVCCERCRREICRLSAQVKLSCDGAMRDCDVKERQRNEEEDDPVVCRTANSERRANVIDISALRSTTDNGDDVRE